MSPRDRRAILFGAAIAVTGWAGLRGLPSLGAWWREGRTRLEAERSLLGETRRAIEALPVMEDSARGLTARVARLAPAILSGSTEAVAVSDLSGRMSTLAMLCHGRVTHFDPVRDSAAAGPLRRVTAAVGFETDFRGVAELLGRLERGALIVVPEQLQITGSDALASGPERLSVELKLTAWYLAREAAS